MYVCIPASNEAVSETPDRNGNSPTSSLAVEMDAALKAEQAVEPASDMQPCC